MYIYICNDGQRTRSTGLNYSSSARFVGVPPGLEKIAADLDMIKIRLELLGGSRV